MGETIYGQLLDRRIPSDWKHVDKYPLRRLAMQVPKNVEVILPVPRQWRPQYDQGKEGACVGYSQSWMMSTLNQKLYAAYRLYAAAQGIDEFDDTPPADGTSNRAGFEVLRTIGHWSIDPDGKTEAPRLDDGISSYHWIKTADEARAAISAGIPINLGINWHRAMSLPDPRPRFGDKPSSRRKDYYIPNFENLGRIDGGHAITAAAASDLRQAIGLFNTWGFDYPFIVWLHYRTFEKLMEEDGECGVVTDRVPGSSHE